MRHSFTFPILLTFIILLVGAQIPISKVKVQLPSDLTGVKIAIYDGGSGVSIEPRESSMAALYWMFRWMNGTVKIVNSTAIKQDVLNDFDIIAIPGGYAYDYHMDLGNDGANAIRNFVAEGGAYWGSCAGAFFACKEIEWSEYGETGIYHYGLNLFPGRGVGPIIGIADWPDMNMTDIKLNTSNGIIDFSQEPTNHSIMYYGGPFFEIGETDGITTLATYSFNSKPAMIAFEYEQGRVFLTGPHPEWEEDSFRDGCVWDNYLDDEGSEWNLSEEVSLWLASSGVNINETTSSVTITSDNTDTNISPSLYYLLIGSIGVIALVVAIVLYRKK